MDHNTEVTVKENRYGYCKCGCGKLTPIAERSDARFGHIKGQPIPRLPRHLDYPRRPTEDRFLEKIQKTEGCWLWTGATTHGGYGVLHGPGKKGKMIRAPRFSYELHYGPVSSDLDILHRCDNPICVRPEHLFTGTAQDNTDDMMAKGRYNKPEETTAKGEGHGMAKLTEEQVLAMRAEYATGETSTRKLAEKYGVSRRAIMFILHREHWKHI